MNTKMVAEQKHFAEAPIGGIGKIAIRVVVLPKKDKADSTVSETEAQPLDIEAHEIQLDVGTTPLASYLEAGKGGRQCCVFLVNGQRQDSTDNTFIVQQLGFKYLRNRMMIIVDVDGLTPEAIGRLMQGSRQGFYRGDVWDAMIRRIVATLKDDPDLVRLEEEAEEQVSELKAGDEKVKHTLDQLINFHHEHGMHYAKGSGAQGSDELDDNLGLKSVTVNGVVSLLPPDEGSSADYPVLTSHPTGSSIRLRPDAEREISVKSMPSNAWPALTELAIEGDQAIPELRVAQERLSDHAKLTLLFREPDGFDKDQYPVRATLRATARFNGINEPRRLELKIIVKPDTPSSPPVLYDPPTSLIVSSRQPIKIKIGETDTHVKLRWNGKDELASGPTRTWTFRARVLGSKHSEPAMNFAEPNAGRLTLLVSPHPEWEIGQALQFEVVAAGPAGQSLSVVFDAEVVQPTQIPLPEKEPRTVEKEIHSGSSRRPPYVLKYINRDDYEGVECWGGANWTDEDPGCFTDPTDRAPLTLIINEDMGALREYRRLLTKSYTESEVERRINKYTSHVAFHLYQMYQASTRQEPDPEGEISDQRQRAEIQRVSMTLIKLMEVSR